MTEGTKSPTIQELRHQARHALVMADTRLVGSPGLSQEDQVVLLTEALTHTQEAAVAIKAARNIAQERDFAAHQEAKAALREVDEPVAV